MTPACLLALILFAGVLVVTIGGLARVDFRCRAGEVATTNHRAICNSNEEIVHVSNRTDRR
jgi:hypothetical protein